LILPTILKKVGIGERKGYVTGPSCKSLVMREAKPQVITYSEEEIMDIIGPAQTCTSAEGLV